MTDNHRCKRCNGNGFYYCLPPGKNPFEMSIDTITKAAIRHECNCKAVADWVASPEGQQSLKETAERVKKIREEAESQERLDHEILRRPMTI